MTLILALLVACGEEQGEDNLRLVNVLTGGTSGVYYPLGVELSRLYGEAMPQVKFSVQATKASIENLNLLQAGRGEVAFTLGDSLADAWRGGAEGDFKVPLKRLRVMVALYPNYVQIVARADSRVRSLADLKGKRISVGVPKSGTELNARVVLRAAGLSYADFARVEYLPFAESVELIKSRQLDVTLQSAGLGVASIKDLAGSVEIAIVPIPPEIVQRIGIAGFQPGVIPANTYKGQHTNVATATINNFLVTHEDVPAEVVYKMTRSVYTGLDRLVAAHPAARDIRLSAEVGSAPAPLHPGARRYYQEIGLLR